MAMRDLLLQLSSYPEPTPAWAVEAAASLAERLDARLSAAMCQVHIPKVSNWLADKLVHANEAIAAENAKSRAHAKALLAEFSATVAAERRGEEILIDCTPLLTPDELARWARTRDLTLIPVDTGLEAQMMAEGVAFGSGRPVLLLPRSGGAGHRFDDIAIGWDGSRPAARALAEALPLLAQARRVRLVQVARDKDIGPWGSLDEARRHLAAHGITAQVEAIDAEGHGAGTVLQNHAVASGADLLVMGAYGHSRTREFVLGGATRQVLEGPQLPVLLSH